jgi:chromosome segregation ATPase
MPWAPRSNIAEENKSPTSLQSRYIRNVAMYSSDQSATTPNTQTLIEQLAASHAVQREQKRRIAELHATMERRDRNALRTKEQRIGDLSKELEQCRKREVAVQAVFLKCREREQELAKREHAVEEKEARLKDREDESKDKDKALEEKMKELMQLQRALGHHIPSTSKLEADRIRQEAGVNYLGPSDYALCRFFSAILLTWIPMIFLFLPLS